MEKLEEEELYKKFKKQYEAERKAAKLKEQKEKADWNRRFEEEGRGRSQLGGRREHEDPGFDHNDPRL